MGGSGYRLKVQAMVEPRMKLIWDTVVTQIEDDGIVKQLVLKNTKNDKISKLELAGVFVAIGSELNSVQWRGLLPLDEEGYIITNELMETKIPGIFAAGDSATAAISAERFLSF